MMDEIKAMLQYAFGTANALTIPISAPGCTNLAGKVWRVGLMGQSACRRNVLFFLAAMEAILGRSGAVAAAR
jgi:aspartate aminotransferase-like enzyme